MKLEQEVLKFFFKLISKTVISWSYDKGEN
jgi:hypothetical protein